MSTILLVPIHLDALYLEHDQVTVAAMADFTRLPYFDGQRDVNHDDAYISAGIVSEAFQNLNLVLKPGVHLHWALPDALTKGDHRWREDLQKWETSFPAVPNRWLVTRRSMSAAGESIIEQEWIVESDYLYPDGEGEASGSIAFPVPVRPQENSSRPFRFMGRRMPFAQWQSQDREAAYLDKLTAVGYGEPAFAAFYPNCRSVFGFHDDSPPRPIPPGLQYEVIGWYANGDQDAFGELVRKLGNAPPDPRLQALKEQFKWTVDAGNDFEFPDRMLCYARLTFDPAAGGEAGDESKVTVAIANTNTEALSAYLAHRIDRSKAAEIEDQLEAIQFEARLHQRQLDIGPKFEEARHEAGFIAVPGGTVWTVRRHSIGILAAGERDAHAEAQMTLPEALAHQLNHLNALQQDYDRAMREIDSLRQQLFADWYKYMQCSYAPAGSDYPDVDLVKHHIEVAALLPLRHKVGQAGQLLLQQDKTGIVVDAAAADADGSLASQLAEAIKVLLNTLREWNEGEKAQAAKQRYVLKPAAGARFWLPREPVVLLSGEGIVASKRHGQGMRSRGGELLECHLLALPGERDINDIIVAEKSKIQSAVADLFAMQNRGEKTSIAFRTWKHQPWHPFLLAWESEVFPVKNKGNAESTSAGYAPDFITDNFWLPALANPERRETPVDLTLLPGRGETLKGANVYRGTAILTPQAKVQLEANLQAYFERELLPRYYEKKKIEKKDRSDSFFNDHWREIFAWYRTEMGHPIGNLMTAYEIITDPHFHCLSQSLGGFNQALLMHKQILQLPIAEPVGFADYQAFTAAVREAVQGKNLSAPVPHNDFNPIRSGELQLLQLMLVDTFGQAKTIFTRDQQSSAEPIAIAHTFRSPERQDRVWLPPRLAQPARINFRWLSADLGEREMNDHPATSPVCGWLLTNHLDNSLMIYDNRGQALGSLNQAGVWEAAPGESHPIHPNDIENAQLKKLVFYLIEQGELFLQDFMLAIDSATDHIDPENMAQHQSRVLLMGRPIALVRTNIGLELPGLPAVQQSWQAFTAELEGGEKETDGFTKVSFPVRIGDCRQFNDSLIGYWVESEQKFRNGTFYCPQSIAIRHDLIKTHQDGPVNLFTSFDDEPQTLLLLMLPQGKVHATCGILPTKEIELPSDQYKDALEAIEITFLSTPLLTDRGKIRIALPNEPGYDWSWLQRDNIGWQEVSTSGVVTKADLSGVWRDTDKLWQRLLDAGWLAPTNGGRAGVVAKDQRKDAKLGDEFQDAIPAIEDIFDRSHIGAVTEQAVFSGTQEIREGWLKLQRRKTDGAMTNKK